jgi:hypothetical protein
VESQKEAENKEKLATSLWQRHKIRAPWHVHNMHQTRILVFETRFSQTDSDKWTSYGADICMVHEGKANIMQAA